ncbi:MAG: NAD(P)-dependent methylenetetrahydromethanopterin dehydrogenase [Planctomycetaceae bacterium]
MKRILLQLDTDAMPSVFDRVVAVDAGVDEIFSYGGVTPENVMGLVHGLMFTRGPADLSHSAIFIGGSDMAAGEAVLKKVWKTLFSPLTVSVMLDSNGSNTTAAAAVRVAASHLTLSNTRAVVLGGTGPVGERAARILAREGAEVVVASRSIERAEASCERIRTAVPNAKVIPSLSTPSAIASLAAGTQLLLAAGAAGVQFLSQEERQQWGDLKVAIDLNAVPPVGLEGIKVTDRAAMQGDVLCYGAIGIGGGKMKLHKQAIHRLFESNSTVLDVNEIYDLPRQ